MKIVIDIDVDNYNIIKNKHINSCNLLEELVRRGTVLPKEHGRLVDADSLLDHILDYGEGQNRLMLIDPYYVRNADTIIEADKGAENE